MIRLVGLLVLVGTAAFGQGQSGATLIGYKTLDICAVNATTWRYSGVITAYNTNTQTDGLGLQIADFVEYKFSGPTWFKAFDVPVSCGSCVVPANTTQETALTFPYSIDAPALPVTVPGNIRNNVSLTILNHSGHLGVPFGPNPKATYSGTIPPPACAVLGCTYTQGYWGNKPDVVWPSPYSRDANFFSSGQTWQQVMDTPVNVSQGYYQLAHQYIAAVLNKANNAPVPTGVQATLDLALAWFSNPNNSPAACTAKGSCGLQKDWAAVLDDYNNGLYPGGPSHCP